MLFRSNQLVSVVNDIEFTSNLVRTQSNTTPLAITASVGRGGTLYFDLTTNSVFNNTSTDVIATSNAVNNLYIETKKIGITGNTFANVVSVAANSYTDYIASILGPAANDYANSVGTSANVYADGVGSSVGSAANTYADGVGSTANAYARVFANTKLANTDSVIAGNLTSTQGFADKIGDMRNIPLINKTTSYVLTLSDNGQVISTNGNITVPNTIFFSGNTISVFNNSAANITISNASSVMMYSAGTANVGSRVLQQRGIATVVCIAANTFVITGAGIVP